jgi:hypothetical protein
MFKKNSKSVWIEAEILQEHALLVQTQKFTKEFSGNSESFLEKCQKFVLVRLG